VAKASGDALMLGKELKAEQEHSVSAVCAEAAGREVRIRYHFYENFLLLLS